MRKKTVVINTDYPLLKTGLAKNGKELANYLHKTGKYNVVYYACSHPWGCPDFERLPYKCVGALPDTQQEMQQIQSKGEEHLRDCSYGLYNIDRVIKEHEPFALITSNDSWASHKFLDKPWWDKIHCLPHITLDSLPFLDQQTDYLKRSKHFLVWADFAEKEAKRLGFNNCKMITGMIPSGKFYKLEKYKKKELRKQNNIPDDAFITGFIYRNQIRKEVGPTIEGYKQFKKNNPQIKNTFLLFHTNFGEPMGWDIPRFCKTHDIPLTEILTTYICRNCWNYEIKSFCGNDLKCKFCQGEKSQININIREGVTEEQLNEIYNLMDCYCHISNAAGLELPICEALYCELPLGTVPYASQEMFTQQDFVYEISCSFGLQLGTQFKRAVPSITSIAKYLEKIYKLSEQERSKIGKRGREWALSKFSPEIVGKQWENLLDSLPEHGYDFNLNKRENLSANPQAQIPDESDNSKWVTSLYNSILGVKPDEKGFNDWMNALKNGVPRQQIESFFREQAAKTVAPQQKEVSFEDLLIKNGKKQFLIVCPESAGDCLYVSATLKSFRESYPSNEWNLYLATKPEYSELFDMNPFLDKVLPFQDFMTQEIACVGSQYHNKIFDGYCYITAQSQRVLNYLGNHKLSINL